MNLARRRRGLTHFAAERLALGRTSGARRCSRRRCSGRASASRPSICSVTSSFKLPRRDQSPACSVLDAEAGVIPPRSSPRRRATTASASRRPARGSASRATACSSPRTRTRSSKRQAARARRGRGSHRQRRLRRRGARGARAPARPARSFVSPYNDAVVAAGQGTIAVELHESAVGARRRRRRRRRDRRRRWRAHRRHAAGSPPAPERARGRCASRRRRCHGGVGRGGTDRRCRPAAKRSRTARPVASKRRHHLPAPVAISCMAGRAVEEDEIARTLVRMLFPSTSSSRARRPSPFVAGRAHRARRAGCARVCDLLRRAARRRRSCDETPRAVTAARPSSRRAPRAWRARRAHRSPRAPHRGPRALSDLSARRARRSSVRLRLGAGHGARVALAWLPASGHGRACRAATFPASSNDRASCRHNSAAGDWAGGPGAGSRARAGTVPAGNRRRRDRRRALAEAGLSSSAARRAGLAAVAYAEANELGLTRSRLRGSVRAQGGDRAGRSALDNGLLDPAAIAFGDARRARAHRHANAREHERRADGSGGAWRFLAVSSGARALARSGTFNDPRRRVPRRRARTRRAAPRATRPERRLGDLRER